MYLIHAEIQAPVPAPAAALGPDTAGVLLASARPQERIEHVAVHEGAGPGAVLGVYLVAGRLSAAETVVDTFCRRAVETVPALRGWTLTRVGAPLVTPFYERLLD
ncbi:hypothetical protein ACFVTF_21015 [Kitasatospora sp. NPDC057940]|uniref:hypothetical protein n=1 Tax=Kitasatospora sp. NPDC057940 TaxID=3346285 RepID=UPI0036D971F0